MLRATLTLTLCLLVTVASGAQTGQSPDAVARSLQQRYAGVRDFSASFVQTYRSGALRIQKTERGTVSVKKPGKMRWMYTEPERKEFVSDGVKVYLHVVQDKQVYVNDVPADNATSGALFLAGKGDVVRDFTASYPNAAPAAPAGALALKLTPRRAEPDYEYLIVTLDPTTLQIRSLTTHDRQGGDSTLTFNNMKENQGLSDKDFAFRVPRGVDVITDGSRN